MGSSLSTLFASFFAGISLLFTVRPGPLPRIAVPPQEDRVARLAKPIKTSVLDRVRIWFEPNEGQLPHSVNFATHTKAYSLYLLPTGLVLRPFQHFQQNVQSRSGTFSRNSPKVALQFVGVNRNAKIMGLEKLQSVSNYFTGSDPRRWQSRIANYSRVE